MKSRIAVLMLAAAAAFSLPTPRPAQADDASKHGPIAWLESIPDAQKAAAKEKKVIFVDFWAEWCGPCKQMLNTTYKDAKVVEKSKTFVPVLVDLDKHQDLAKKYQFEAIPTVIFLDAKGKVLEKHTGYLAAADFLKLMEKAQKKLKA